MKVSAFEFNFLKWTTYQTDNHGLKLVARKEYFRHCQWQRVGEREQRRRVGENCREPFF